MKFTYGTGSEKLTKSQTKRLEDAKRRGFTHVIVKGVAVSVERPANK